MQITGLRLTNWLTHRSLTLSFPPMILIAGPNDSGKSSVADAISFAITGTLRRVDAARERRLLLSEGADRGSVALRAGDTAIQRDIASGRARSRYVPRPAQSGRLLRAIRYRALLHGWAF